MRPLITPRFQAFDSNGDPLSGGKVFFYQAGTSTKQDTYTTSACSVANANPVVLDSRGEAAIYLNQTTRYKIILTSSTDTDPPAAAIWTEDNVDGNSDIYDTSGNLLLKFTKVSSAVNYVTLTNAATGNAPSLVAAGSDTNISLALLGKGSGTVMINSLPIITKIARQIITSTSTYTPTTGMKYALVTLVGAGGGGAGASAAGSQNDGGAGGGGGGVGVSLLSASTIGSSQTVTLGAAGAAGVAGGAGGQGGTTTFGSIISITGGAGGTNGNSTATAAAIGGLGGAGGVSTGGTINITGQTGEMCIYGGSSAFGVFGGGGGNSALGYGLGGRRESIGTYAGVVGKGYGAGGSGASAASAGSVAGAAGLIGVCIIDEYCQG